MERRIREAIPNRIQNGFISMNCLICRQALLVDGFTSIHFEREEFRMLIQHVPARICPQCGEALVEEQAVLRVLDQAEEALAQGMREAVREY